MYRLLIVDDEEYAVEGIVRAIDWSSIEISNIDTAYCVEEAQECMKTHPADIILCDIEMPGQNGMDFLRWLKKNNYMSRLIFLTAYAQFNYAQEAIALGVSDYLVKPVEHNLLKKKVQEVLQGYENYQNMADKASNYEKYEALWKSKREDIINIFWRELLTSPAAGSNQDRIQSMMQLYNIEVTDDVVSILLISADWNEEENQKEDMVRMYGLCDMTSLLLSDEGGSVVYLDENHCAMICYNCDLIQNENLKSLRLHVEKELNCRLEFYFARRTAVFDLNNAYSQLKRAEDRKLFSEESTVIDLSEKSMQSPLSMPAIELISSYLEENSRSALKSSIEKYLHTLADSDLNYERITSLLRILYYRIISAVLSESIKRDASTENRLSASCYDESVCINIRTFQKWFHEVMDLVLPDSPKDSEDSIIASIQNYILQNLNQDLTRESIADHVYLNSSYLSRMYHKQTGETLSDYILHARIQKAKHLLVETDDKIQVIAQATGYSNDSYFIRVFRLETGMTPFEYRKKHR